MKRRRFIQSAGGTAAALGLFPGCSLMGKNSSHLVDTPEKREAYLKKMLALLCDEIGPRPSGSENDRKAAARILQEMALALPQTEMDTFSFTKWEILKAPELTVAGNALEVYASVGCPSAPKEGIEGVLVMHSKDRGRYAIQDAKSGKTAAFIEISAFGKAVPRYYGSFADNTNKYEDLPAFCVGKQDVPVLEKAVAAKSPVRADIQAEFVENALTANVVGKLPGVTKEEIIVIGHADTHYNTPGANDNTASMIAVLMLAHALSGTKPKRTLTFMASGAEEIGCLGAKHYAEKRKKAGTLKNIKFCLNFDSLTYGPNFQLYSTDQALKDIVLKIHKELGINTEPKLFDRGDGLDGRPFQEAGARTLYVNSRGYDWTLPLWHRPEDKPDMVKPELIENSFRVFKEYLNELQKI
jgi:hypothetical protein